MASSHWSSAQRDSTSRSITFLNRSLRNAGHERIGIVLSGTGSDGTAGLRAIKAAGGLTFAQTEASAKFDAMPRSAIRSGFVDVVLPPDAIAREIRSVLPTIHTSGVRMPMQRKPKKKPIARRTIWVGFFFR